MQHRIVDNFAHVLRAGRDQVPDHDDLKALYEDAIEKIRLLADGLYKKARSQVDENVH